MALNERSRERDWIPIISLSLCHLTSWEGAAYFSTIAHQVCVLKESKKILILCLF